MIPINRGRIPLAEIQTLIDAATTAQEEINREKNPRLRKELIESHRQKWVDFRTAFDKLSHGKCWYTESKNSGTDDDVDHFRPKNRLADDKKHGGYYWEALNWKNFRLSCHRANRLRENPTTKKTHGKADHFPLLNPTQRACKPNDDLDAERPLLLDPCDPFDPPKLTFNPDGMTTVALAYEKDKDAVAQVEASRKLLHLDWVKFVNDRTELYNLVTRKIEEGEQHAARTEKGDIGSRVALRAIATELQELTLENKPYSAAARAYILRFRNRWWVWQVVLNLPHPEPVGRSK